MINYRFGGSRPPLSEILGGTLTTILVIIIITTLCSCNNIELGEDNSMSDSVVSDFVRLCSDNAHLLGIELYPLAFNKVLQVYGVTLEDMSWNNFTVGTIGQRGDIAADKKQRRIPECRTITYIIKRNIFH